MTDTVFVLTEANNRAGFPIGVFATLDLAIDAAKSRAQRMIEIDVNQQTPGIEDRPENYDTVVRRDDVSGDVAVINICNSEIKSIR